MKVLIADRGRNRTSSFILRTIALDVQCHRYDVSMMCFSYFRALINEERAEFDKHEVHVHSTSDDAAVDANSNVHCNAIME